ncbi:JmjC domain-containing protein [Fusarium keratoplasticum]|uniref:JmjC domain-containing protein n=1 Tax=Fusarium keratoplasticum TaxID=1328300 RepID=A0ACC0QRV7_9HYPO|nr:JmjC domain-containing protein [Fusarium keratoplasticum]KAI8663481.1 JmjC domain-containing protein [Fusarium keratoplasticum]
MSELESPYWGDIRSLRNELNNVKRLLEDIRAYLPSEPTPQRRSKRSTIRHATQQDKPPAWAEQIITRFSILEDWIGRIQSQTDDIEAHNRRNGTQQPQVHSADGHYEGSLRSPPPQDSGMASASTHQRREAEPEDQAPANAHGDNSATSIEATGDPSSDGSDKDKDKDTSMRDCEQVPPSPPGGTDAAASAASASRSASRQATANDQGDIPATNHTPEAEAEASAPEDEDVVMGDSDAAQEEDNAKSGAADHRSARSSAPEDDTGGDKSEANPQTQPTTANPTGQGAGAQVNMQSPFSATPEERTMQLPTTPNSQGSDTTKDTSRATTPDTHLTSPDTSVPDSPSQFTLSEADMGEGLVEALERIIKRDDSMHKISVPNLPVDLDLIKAAVKAELSAPNPDWQFTANRFVPGPKGEGYMRAYISKRQSHFAFPDFPDKVVIPTEEEARKWLDDYFDNPPKGIVPYFTGHLDLPYGDLLNPGTTLLDNPKLLDLHRPYWHIGGDKSANRFHIEDYSCSEDESPCGLRSANLVLEGVKLWTAIKVHHTKKFEAFVAKNWDCNECSQHVGHQSLLISPLILEREGIDFEIKVQGRGELMLTGRSQYHMVVNMGSNIAISMNHLQRGDRLKSTALRQCVKCGVLDDTVTRVPPPKSSEPRTPLPSIPNPPPEQSEARSPLPTLLGKRPRTDQQGTQTSGRETRADTAARRKLNALEEEIRKRDPACRIPRVPRDSDSTPPEKVFKAAASVQSSLAVKQFISLVDEWRRRDEHMFLSGDTRDILLQHGKRLAAAIGKSSLSKFLYRYAQACVARELDMQMKKRGSIRRSKEDTERLAQQLGMETEELKAHLEDGRIWNSICGPEDDGLLPFLLLESKWPFKEERKEDCPLYVKKKEWKSLVRDVQVFHSLLDVEYVKKLRQVGRAFEEMISTGSEQVFGLEDEANGWESLRSA